MTSVEVRVVETRALLAPCVESDLWVYALNLNETGRAFDKARPVLVVLFSILSVIANVYNSRLKSNQKMRDGVLFCECTLD